LFCRQEPTAWSLWRLSYHVAARYVGLINTLFPVFQPVRCVQSSRWTEEITVCRSARRKTQTVGAGRSSRARDNLSHRRDFTLPRKNRRYHRYCMISVLKSNSEGNVGNTEVCSCNHCHSGKAVSATHSEGVDVALGIQHAMRMRHIIVCDLPDCTIFSHNILQTRRFSIKILNTKYVWSFCIPFV
jgi:hypothetical protein